MIVNYIKSWTWTRVYDLKYDFSKSLKLSLVANANAFVNEPPGLIDRSNEKQVWNQIFSFGTLSTYNQQLSGTYDVPISKIPYLDWISVNLGYQASYHRQPARLPAVGDRQYHRKLSYKSAEWKIQLHQYIQQSALPEETSCNHYNARETERQPVIKK